MQAWSLVPYDLTHALDVVPPPLATLVTSQFLHGSIPHIAANMLVLGVFGPEVEALLGPSRFVAFYLTCGIFGGLAQAFTTPGSHVPEIGASGAIAGVLGAYIIRFPLRSFASIPAALVIALWAGAQFVHGFGNVSTSVLSEQGGGIAYFAHIGGFLAGVLAIGAFVPPSARGAVR